VVIVRRQQTAVYPTRFMLVAATNPCPCGYAGDPSRCRCSKSEIARHRRKLGGPLLDRIELLMRLRRPSAAELRAPPHTTSARARERVAEARARQARRLRGTGAACNAELDLGLLRSHARIDVRAEEVLRRAYERGTISARGHVRMLRVARTIADLDGSERVRRGHLNLALTYHPEGRQALARQR
jgi:magnesium chelatase family protein